MVNTPKVSEASPFPTVAPATSQIDREGGREGGREGPTWEMYAASRKYWKIVKTPNAREASPFPTVAPAIFR